MRIVTRIKVKQDIQSELLCDFCSKEANYDCELCKAHLCYNHKSCSAKLSNP